MENEQLVEEFMRKMRELQKMKHKNPLSETPNGENLILHYIKIKQEDGEVIPSEISNKMGFSSARIAAVLNSLETKGYVTREIDSDDRRRIIIKLTDDGNKHENELATKRKQFLSQLIFKLGEEDTKEYLRIIDKIAKIISELER